MSHIFPVGSVGHSDRGDQHLQLEATLPSSGRATAAIGVTYIPGGENSTLRKLLDEAETQVIRHALHHTGWNRKRAAALLKISYRGLLYKIHRHSIRPATGG